MYRIGSSYFLNSTTIRSDLPILLITPPPIDPSESDDLGLSSKINRQYADQVLAMAKSSDCGVVDLFDVLTGDDHYWTDGVHLNELGNERVYDAVVSILFKRYPYVEPARIQMEKPPWRELADKTSL